MRSDETDRHSSLNFRRRLGMCVAATLLAIAAAGGCSSGSGATPDGSSTGGASGTIGMGTGGSKAQDGGTGGVKSDGGVVAAVNGLGTTCKTSTDCAAGLTCLAPTDKTFYGVGGAANGYCSVACTSNANCGASGSCLNIGTPTVPAGFCFLDCTPGAAAAGAQKCNNRADVACSPLADSAGNTVGAACFPTCSQDTDCPMGLKCDPLDNVCVATPHDGQPAGMHCAFDPTGQAVDPCAGFCLPVGDATGKTVIASFCSSSCTFGSLSNCNAAGAGMPLSMGSVHGICLPLSDTPGTGDIGVCFQECDKPSDCGDKSDPALSCDLSVMAATGHGICAWGNATSADGGVTDGGVTDGAGQ